MTLKRRKGIHLVLKLHIYSVFYQLFKSDYPLTVTNQAAAKPAKKAKEVKVVEEKVTENDNIEDDFDEDEGEDGFDDMEEIPFDVIAPELMKSKQQASNNLTQVILYSYVFKYS